MISRIWHCWTLPENADAFEALQRNETYVGFQERHIPGYRGIQMFRREAGGEVEFMTVMWFDTLEAVRLFAGDDYEAAVIAPKARRLLARCEARTRHYEVCADMQG